MNPLIVERVASFPALSALAGVLAVGCAFMMLARVATPPPGRTVWHGVIALGEFVVWTAAFCTFLLTACAFA